MYVHIVYLHTDVRTVHTFYSFHTCVLPLYVSVRRFIYMHICTQVRVSNLCKSATSTGMQNYIVCVFIGAGVHLYLYIMPSNIRIHILPKGEL